MRTQHRQHTSDSQANKTIFVAALLLTVLFSALGWHALNRLESLLVREAMVAVTAANDGVASALKLWLRIRLDEFEHVLDNHEAREAAQLIAEFEGDEAVRFETADVFGLLSAERLEQLGATGIAILDLEGMPLLAEGMGDADAAVLTDPVGRKAFQRIIRGDFAILRRNTLDAERPSFGLASRMYYGGLIKTDHGEARYAVIVGFDLADLLSPFTFSGRLGDSGETYAVAPNGYLITPSRFIAVSRPVRAVEGDPSLPLEQQPALIAESSEATALTEAVTRVMSGETGASDEPYLDYRGVMVIGAWTWLDGFEFGLVSEIDRDEALAAYDELEQLFLGIWILMALFTFAIGVWMSLANRKQRLQLEQLVDERTATLAAAERRARYTRDRYDLVLDAASLGVVELDREGRILFCNSAGRSMLGLELAHIDGENFHRLVHHSYPDGRPYPESECPMHQAILDGAPHEVDGEVFWRPDGSSFAVHYHATPIHEEGELVSSILIFRDVSERLEFQRQLAENEARFRALVNTIPGTVYQCLLDEHWTMKFISDEIMTLSGYRASDFIENRVRSYTSIIYPDDQQMVAAVIEGAVRDMKSFVVEYRVMDIDGRVHHVLEKGVANFDEDGNPIELMGTVIDISERHRSEQALRDARNRLNAASEAANIGMWEYYPQIKQIAVTANLLRMRGFAFEQMVDRIEGDSWGRLKGGFPSWQGMTDPEDAGTYVQTLNRHLRGETDLFRAEYRVHNVDDEVQWVLDTGRVVEWDLEHRPTKVVGVIIDITEIKRLQVALEAARVEAEQATAAKSEFLANMSHEIRTPMNAVIGMTHLALQTELNSKQRNYIEKTKASAEALLGIINDILDFSKIEARRLSIESVQFSLDKVMTTLSNQIGFRAEEKGIELLFKVDGSVPHQFQGDPLRIGQILLNLGTNAIKFTEAGGEVVIALDGKVVEGGQYQLHCMVKDSGIGISEEQQKKLFQSFSQADSSTTRRFGGTGLGLAICKNLVELMNGRIWVESEEGHGSAFHFVIDLTVDDEERPTHQSMIDGELNNVQVLLVDDNATARQILEEMLVHLGVAVTPAASAKEALLLVGNDPTRFDVALVDWKMPDVDGVGFARELQAKFGADAVPKLVLVTAYGRENAADAAADGNVEVAEYLTKPVTPASLTEALWQVTGKGQSAVKVANQQNGSDSDLEAELEGFRVLLVEDNEVNLELETELLESYGLEVTVAKNGLEAIERLQNVEVDGVLMDCQMPVMDGYEATRRLREDPRFKTLPIIAMTGNAMAGDRERVIEAGMNDHIAKPIDVDVMVHILHRWLVKHGV